MNWQLGRSARVVSLIRFSVPVFLNLLLLSEAALAQCQGSCQPQPAPPAPSASPNPSTTGSFQLSVPNGMGHYGYTKWSTGQTTPAPTSGGSSTVLSVSGKLTGSYLYNAQICYYQGNVCSASSPYTTVIVVKTPGNPAVNVTAPVCGSLNVSWSPGSGGYPASGYTRRYDLEQSTNGVNYSAVSGRSNTTAVSWTHPAPVENTTYYYRVRAWYTWNGHTSNKTGWVVGSRTYPVCPPTPGTPVLSQPSITNSLITASWSAPAYGITYHLQRRNLTTASAWAEIYSGASTSYADTGATARGNTYAYQVNACQPATGNCSTWSAPVEVELYQTVNTGYQYDALGRLVRVVRDGTARAGYCYDRSGNRYQVVANSADCSGEPPLPAPTDLWTSTHAGNGYVLHWNGVSGATQYRLRLDKFNTAQPGDMSIYPVINNGGATSYSTPSWYEPVWIQACNALTCSAKVYY